jgi:hypothetical protein
LLQDALEQRCIPSLKTGGSQIVYGMLNLFHVPDHVNLRTGIGDCLQKLLLALCTPEPIQLRSQDRWLTRFPMAIST